MRVWKSWIVTKKDLSVFKKNKYVLYSLVAMPMILGVVLPIIFIFALHAQADQLLTKLTALQKLAAARPNSEFGYNVFCSYTSRFCPQ